MPETVSLIEGDTLRSVQLRIADILLRARERSEHREHTVVLSLRFLSIHSNSPYPDSPNRSLPSTGAGLAGKSVCTYILAGTL